MMTILKLLLFSLLAFSLVLLGAFILPTPGFSPTSGIILGTLVFLIVSITSIIVVDRYERKRLNEVDAEIKFLRAFQRWTRRIRYGEDGQFLKLKYKQKANLRRVYLEDFIRDDLVRIRSKLPEGYQLSDYGQIDRIDQGLVDLEGLLNVLGEQGWRVYYVRKASPDQLFTIQHLRRGMETGR